MKRQGLANREEPYLDSIVSLVR